MKKVLYTLVLLSAPLCAQQYATIGVGPHDLVPCFGIGNRDNISGQEIDYSLSISPAHYYFNASSGLTLINRPFNDSFYCGPNLSAGYTKLKYWGSTAEANLGFTVGRDFEGEFLDISIQKQIYHDKIKIQSPSVRVRWGIYF